MCREGEGGGGGGGGVDLNDLPISKEEVSLLVDNPNV